MKTWWRTLDDFVTWIKPQNSSLSVMVSAWYRRPSRFWNRGMAGALALIAIMCTLGILESLNPGAFESWAWT